MRKINNFLMFETDNSYLVFSVSTVCMDKERARERTAHSILEANKNPMCFFDFLVICKITRMCSSFLSVATNSTFNDLL